MPLILTEEQTMLQEAADGFLGEHAPIAHLRKLRDERDPDGVSRDLWRAFGEMGFAGVIIPEAHGGSGLGAVEAGVIAGSLGRTPAPSPFFGSRVLSAKGRMRGSEAQQAEWQIVPSIDALPKGQRLAQRQGRNERGSLIEQGRRTFANTMKYIAITISANFGNMVSMALATPLLPFLPLLPKQILLNNFLSDIPATAIAGDRVDSEMVERPRRWDTGRNVASYATGETAVSAGLMWPGARTQLGNKPAVIAQPRGRGHVIAFVEDPNFRAFMEGTELLFMNAVLLGPAH